jgi:hypothetical protein
VDVRNNNIPRLQITPKLSVFHLDQTFRLVPDRRSYQCAYEYENAWLPLARLVKRLPKLSDLIYTCANQFSPCLLRALETFRPDCKLHIKTFRLRSLNEKHLDPHELAICESPCLHSISVSYVAHSSTGGRIDYNEDAAMKLVAGMAPNLKEVSTILLDNGHRRMDHIPPWQGFGKDKQEQMPSLGSLQVLDLDGVQGRPMRDWLACTDLSVLRVFRYHRVINLDQLTYLKTSCNFPSLTTLGINIEAADRSREAYHECLGRFLRGLSSLESLELVGGVDHPTFLVVLEMPSTRLKKLCLLRSDTLPPRMVVGAPEVKMLNTSFPSLEELIVKISRSRGNAQEVAIYKALGSMPKLRNLSLTLDVMDLVDPISRLGDRHRLPNDPTFDEFDRQVFNGYTGYRNGHIRDLFINSALDETLARAIFDSISTAQPAKISLVESLKVRVTRENTFQTDVRSVAVHLAHAWTVERSADQDKYDVVTATEDEIPAEEDENSPMPTLNGRAGEIFRRIWPLKKQGGDWRQDWKSWPLWEG